MADEEPLGGVAGAVTDALAKAGSVDTIVEFGVLWTGLIAIGFSGGLSDPAALALQIVGGILTAGGSVALLWRVIKNVR